MTVAKESKSLDDETRRSLLKEEYLYLQSVIESFDQRALTIKAWSVTFSLAALVGAFAYDAREVLLVASLSALLFWFIEGFWKTFQDAYYDRTSKLEDYFAGRRQGLVPMQIGKSWLARYKKRGSKRLFHIMLKWPHVFLPHAVVFTLGLLLYVLALLDRIAM